MNINNNQKVIIWIGVFSLITIVLWQIPFGMLILYPFTILGTWFHEMGHGLMAVLLGGSFERLEIYSNGSGLAYWNGDLFFGGFGKAMVAAAGPLGPTIAGSLFIIFSRKERAAKITLIVLTILLLISGVYLVRTWFGTPVILGFAVIFGFIAFKGNRNWQKYTLIFLGVQACLSIYMSIGYLLSPGGEINGKVINSDTVVMQNELVLPYWFWGTVLIFISVFAIYTSLAKVYNDD